MCLNVFATLAIILKHVVGRSTASLFLTGSHTVASYSTNLMMLTVCSTFCFVYIIFEDFRHCFKCLQHDVLDMQYDVCVLLSAT